MSVFLTNRYSRVGKTAKMDKQWTMLNKLQVLSVPTTSTAEVPAGSKFQVAARSTTAARALTSDWRCMHQKYIHRPNVDHNLVYVVTTMSTPHGYVQHVYPLILWYLVCVSILFILTELCGKRGNSWCYRQKAQCGHIQGIVLSPMDLGFFLNQTSNGFPSN